MFKDVVVERGKLAKGQLIASQFLRQLGSLMDMINVIKFVSYTKSCYINVIITLGHRMLFHSMCQAE
jgi:hypothetical protein